MSSLGLGVWADAERGDRPADNATKNQIAAPVPTRREVPGTRVELSINIGFDTTPTGSVWPSLCPPVSDRYFVDTNILMYAHDTTAGKKHARATVLVERLWESRSGVVSTQVLQELAVNLRRKAKKPLDTKATRDIVSDYLAWQVVVDGGDSILEALDIEVRYRVSFWDALFIQAAHAAGAAVLYSEDPSSGQSYGQVQVVNPLA